MKKELIITGDGSSSIFLPELNEHYHSIHGAIRESEHVYLKNGLHKLLPAKKLNILEIGFGTGLNAWLTIHESEENNFQAEYLSLEAFPLDPETVEKLNYTSLRPYPFFKEIHESPWEKDIQISSNFKLLKINSKLEDFEIDIKFDLIYFDAFAPTVQPELWTKEIFENLYSCLNYGGLLVTYCAKGEVRRTLKEVGFEVQRLQGPPGKLHMTFAKKV